jgi:hypothetical protein
MAQSTSQAWQKAALETLLWLLDPDRAEAETAYLRLFERLVVYFRHRARGSDPEELAEQTLTRAAEAIYLRLTGLSKEDLSRPEVVHGVPRSIGPELYAAERARVPVLAFSFARYAFHENYRAARRQEPDLQAPPLQESRAIAEERLRLLELALSELTPDDRRLIEEYYDIGDRGKRPSRTDLAKHLGLTASALSVRAYRIRRRLMAGMTAGESPVQAQFTAYYPRSAQAQGWSTILVYMHVPDALPLVQSDARRRLSEAARRTRSKTTAKKVGIARGARIIVVPQSEALEFNPPQAAFVWLEDYHCVEFRCRFRSDVNAAANARYASVKVAFHVAPILVAEIAFTIGLSHGSEHSSLASVTAHPYQRVFVSYSHRDSGIADQLEKAYKALGIEYMRDLRMLRSGEKWVPTLLQRIDESEIFQLLWSKAAEQSAYVRQEWQHAQGLHRCFFIRPVYWDKPMTPPPQELADIHFAYLELRENHL